MSVKRISKGERALFQAFDLPMLLLLLLLLTVGIIVLFSASYPDAYYDKSVNTPFYYVIRQGAFIIFGLVAMYFISLFDYHKLHIPGVILMGGSLIVLVLMPFIGTTRNNATRWIDLGFTMFQPSEVVKTAVIITFASFASRNTKRMKTLTYGILPYMGVIGVIAVLLALQPHFSATIIITLTGIVIIFVAGINFWYFVAAGVAGGALGLIYALNTSHTLTRIKVWLDPFIDPVRTGWQAVQSFISIGSGGIWGLGLGRGRQKYLYLPEPYNDFIFSVACEELGFVGAVIIIILFAAFIFRGFIIAIRAKDKFGCLLATGIVAKVAIQTLMNMAVVTGVIPVTGAALPFFSYGGTALLVQLAEIGVLLNISRQSVAVRAE